MTGPSRAAPEVLFDRGSDAAARGGAVTVAVSLFEYERFVEECLDSVRAQTHAAVELIVVDDASARDASAERCRAWMERHAGRFDRALLLRHPRNLGLAEARNTAFLAARTDFVFVLDADNSIFPRALARLLESAQAASAEVSYSQIAIHGDRIGLGHADVWSRHRMRIGNYVDAMALVGRAAWREVGGYSHLEGGWEDFDFWCKLMERGTPAIFVPEILCRYRIHGTSMLRTSTVVSTEQLKVDLTVRHPWLDLI